MKKSLKFYLVLALVIVLSSSVVMAATYTVKTGDTLWKIADKQGVSTEDLAAANSLDNPNMIYEGQLLNLPSSKVTSDQSQPKYVFYLIGDGLGAAQRELTELYLQQTQHQNGQLLAMDQLPEGGINSTYCANTLITDSAAAGTALASGVKTNKGVIGQDVNGKDVKTLVEEAEEAGMATGIVTSTRLTHATPAVFASHNPDRNDENAIAQDYVDSGVDFFAGGGARYFLSKTAEKVKDSTGTTIKSKRTDDLDVFAEFEAQGYKTFYGEEGTKAFKNTDFTKVDKVLAPLTYSHLPYEVDRANLYPEMPSLSELASAAVDSLSQNEKGFFLMVEGGRIDHACHQNDAATAVQDVLAFDNVVKVALDFYNKHPEETLIVVVGDHETGGLGLGFDGQGYFMDTRPMQGAKVSIADVIAYNSDYAYDGDRDQFIKTVTEDLGLGQLTDSEMALLTKGMDDFDAGITYGYYKYDSASMAVTQIVSQRMNVNWTTTIHTGTMIPFTAKGVGADQFNGYIDNTDISRTLANIMHFDMK